MTIAVHPEFKQSTRGDLLASAEQVIPLRLHPYQAFSDFAITWRDVGNQGAELTPTGALRDFAAMQAARTSFRAREMTTKDVVEHLQGPGLEVANLGVSAVITCEPFGPGRGRYLGVVSQRRADFLPAGNRLGTSNVPKTNKLLSGYVNWFDLVRAEGHSLTGSALSRALLSELEEGEVLPWQRLEEEGVQLGQILQGVVRDVLPRSIGRELVIEDRNTLLTQGACTFVPGRDHAGSFAQIGDHFSGLFDVHPDKTYSIGPTAPSRRVALSGIGRWSPVVIDGMPYDVGLNYYAALGALQAVVQVELKLPQDLHGISVAHSEFAPVNEESAVAYGFGKKNGLGEFLDPQGFRWIPIDEDSNTPNFNEGLFLILNGKMEKCDIDGETELLSEAFVDGGPTGIVEAPHITFDEVRRKQ